MQQDSASSFTLNNNQTFRKLDDDPILNSKNTQSLNILTDR